MPCRAITMSKLDEKLLEVVGRWTTTSSFCLTLKSWGNISLVSLGLSLRTLPSLLQMPRLIGRTRCRGKSSCVWTQASFQLNSVLRELICTPFHFTKYSDMSYLMCLNWEAKTCNTQKTERLFCNWYCWHILNTRIKPMMKNKHILDCFCFFCLLTNSHSKWGETNLSQLSPLSSTFQMSSIWKIPKQNSMQKSVHFNKLIKTPIIATCCIVRYLPRADTQSELCAFPFVCSWLYSFPTIGPAR